MEKVTGYELSRSFFDWSYENVGKVKPVHVALYFFAIEHCNRLGWKAQFGMPTQMSMDAIGIKNWKTYSAAFNDLEEWGFFRVVERSKNQYSATVIALVKNTKALSKALSKASQKHYQKHCPEQVQSIVGIDKLNNLEPITSEQSAYNLAYFNKQGYSFPISGKVASEIDRFLNYRAKHQLHGPIKSGEQVEAIILNFKDLNYTDEMISRAITDTIAKGAKNIICEQKPVTQQPTSPKIKNLT